MGYLEMARGIPAPGVEGNATVLQGNVRNLGDPCSCTRKVLRPNNRRGRKPEDGKGVGLSHSSDEVG